MEVKIFRLLFGFVGFHEVAGHMKSKFVKTGEGTH
jgi:hypothetical protein